MEYAQTIAMAKALLDDGRADDVVQMVEPVLEPIDAPAASTGQLLLRTLRARVSVVSREAPAEAFDLLPSRTAVADLCTCVRAEVNLWRGWAHALRNEEVGENPQALRLLRSARELHASIHDPAGQCWAWLGRALACYNLDEYSLQQQALNNAAPLVDALDDVLARQWLLRLRIPALRAREALAEAESHIESLKALAGPADRSAPETIALAYETALRSDRESPPDDILAAAKRAEAALSRSPVSRPGLRLLVQRAQIDALIRKEEWGAAREVADQIEADWDTAPVGLAPFFHSRIALRQDRAENLPSLSSLLHTERPLPRGLNRTSIMQAHGRCLKRQNKTKAARRWLQRAGQTTVSSPQEAKTAEVPVTAQSSAMQATMTDLRRAHASRCPVLLRGEQGTGKARLARALHSMSTRADGPFARIAPSNLQHNPTEEQLFGSAEGDEWVPGAVHEADGGTLLIEDVDALSLSAQKALLTLLNTGRVWPPGASSPTAVDVRVVATTETSLDEQVRNSHFRPDLRDWLQILPLTVPPLRERRDDIPLLVRRFLKTNGPNSATAASITQPAMEALLRYDWPGNVRQLRNEIERVLVHVSSEPAPTIDTDRLLDTIVEHAQSRPAPSSDPSSTVLHPNQSLSDVLSQTEAEVIERVLQACEGQVTASADVLGLTRQGLYKKMKRLDIDASEFQPTADPAPSNA